MEKRKLLRELSPPLTKDTVLFFSLKEPHVKEAGNVRDDQRDEIKTKMEETEIKDPPRETESQEVNTAGHPTTWPCFVSIKTDLPNCKLIRDVLYDQLSVK